MAENRKYPLGAEVPIREGQVLTGPQFSEPMRVETVRSNGPDVWVAGLVGQQSEQFRRVTLTSNDISSLTIADAALSYDGNGRLLRIGLQAYSLGIAYEFDPYFGLSISRVDPLPHQLEAVYEHLLKLPTVRFLLADDAGAGKTIMAGLLIRELKLRGPHRTGSRRLPREPRISVAARAQGKVRRAKNTNELKTGAPGRFDRHRPMASPRSGACRRRCRRFGFPVRAGKTPSSNGMPRSRAETWIQARAAHGPERASRLRRGSPGLDSGPLGVVSVQLPADVN